MFSRQGLKREKWQKPSEIFKSKTVRLSHLAQDTQIREESFDVNLPQRKCRYSRP